MPDTPALHDFKQAANDNIGVMSAHLTAENAGIESLLDEGRETTFNLVETKKDGHTSISTPTFIGPAEAGIASQLDRLTIDADLVHNNFKVTGSAYTEFTDKTSKDPGTKPVGSEDINFEANVALETLLGTQSPSPITIQITDSLKDENRKVIVEQTSSCAANIYSQGVNPFDGDCKGKITTASGAEYDFTRKADFAHSLLTINSNGKQIGTVETNTQVGALATTFTVKVKPGS